MCKFKLISKDDIWLPFHVYQDLTSISLLAMFAAILYKYYTVSKPKTATLLPLRPPS